ncbi:MAG: TusE/DsrC/DsvC family sulfur relay protein [Gammaproteobacteria bacterium]|jgi:tRNA 2-thiouridine synthesizing protein E
MASFHIEFDEYRFMKDPAAWNRGLAAELAANEGITHLGEKHWKVLDELRRHYKQSGSVPVMRQICHDVNLEPHCISELFANPGRAWRIAGLPDPGEEARAYLETADVPGDV